MQSSDQDNEAPPRRVRRTVAAWFGAMAFAGICGGSAALAIAALNSRAASDDLRTARAPITVDTREIQFERSYKTAQSFVGRIEPSREVAASFERSGLVTEIAVDEGDTVRAGQPIARLDTRPLEIELERLAADRAALVADLDLAKATMARREALQGRGFESRQSFDEAKFSAQAITARIDALEARRRSVTLDIEKSTVAAPFDGRVSERFVDERAVVATGAAVLVLQETTQPQARIGVPVDLAQKLTPNEPLKVSVGGQSANGTVASVSPDLDPATRTVSVRIDLPTGIAATMGDVVRLEVEREIGEAGAWVPLGALREAARGLWALQTVVQEGETTRLSSAVVEVLYVRDNRAFVRGSLPPGTRYVAAAPHRGAESQAVEVPASEPQP